MSLFQKLRSDATGYTYANLSKLSHTYRFKTTSSNKSLNGRGVLNNVVEIILNDSHDITIGDAIVQDPLSVRLKISGSYLSKDRKVELVNSLISTLSAWADEGVFEGFEPSTLPVDTV
jgi:hypothetical protein